MSGMIIKSCITSLRTSMGPLSNLTLPAEIQLLRGWGAPVYVGGGGGGQLGVGGGGGGMVGQYGVPFRGVLHSLVLEA